MRQGRHQPAAGEARCALRGCCSAAAPPQPSHRRRLSCLTRSPPPPAAAPWPRAVHRAPQDEDDDLLPTTEPKDVDYFAGRSEEGWQTLLYSHRYAAVIQSGESDGQIALDVHGMEQLAKGEVAHGTAVNCFKEKHPDLTLDLGSSSAHYMSVLQQLFMQLRLLSFTTGGD